MDKVFFRHLILFLVGSFQLAVSVSGQVVPGNGHPHGDAAIPGIVAEPARNSAARQAVVAQPSVGDAVPAQTSPVPALTCEKLLEQVDQNHPKVQGAAAERRLAAAKRLEKQGAFDPSLSFGGDYLRFNKIDDKGRAKPAEATDTDVSLDFLTRSGIKFSLGARYNYGSVKSPLSPTGDSGEYFFLFKMPLLRNFRLNEKSAAERQAQLGEPLADTTLLQTRLEIRLKAAGAYWDWVAAKRRLEVAKTLVEIARVRAAAIRERADLGDLPPIDKVEAEQEVRRREGNLIKAERDLQKAALKLAGFRWDDQGQPEPLPDPAAVPLSTPQPVPLPPDQVLSGRTLALERRPELKAIQILRSVTQIDADLARNQRLPAVDLTFGPGRDTGFNGIGTTLKAGVTISWGLRQRTADGQWAASQSKLQKLNFEEQAERQRILLEVEDAASAVATTCERYQAAEQELQLAKVLERGERDRFVLGDSTLFLVNQRERATAEAAVKMIDLQAEYEQALATFRVATVQF